MQLITPHFDRLSIEKYCAKHARFKYVLFHDVSRIFIQKEN
jgi:hypothetical protein